MTQTLDHFSTRSGDDDTYDPRDVPRYPVLRGSVSPDQRTITVEGFEHPVPYGHDSAESYLMERFTALAAERPTRDVRVIAVAHDGTEFRMVVHADGGRWDENDLHTDPTDSKATPRKRALIAGVIASALILTAAGGALAWWQLRPDTATVATQSPVIAPPGESPLVPVWGYARRAQWVSDPIAQRTVTPVLINDVLIYATDAGALTATNVATGQREWALPLPARATSPLVAGEHEGTPVVMWTSRDALYMVAASGEGELLTIPRERRAKLVPGGQTPLLWDARTHTAWVFIEGELQPRVVPAEATPVLAQPDGTVFAADHDGRWWNLTSHDTAPSPQTITPPTAQAQPDSLVGGYGATVLYMWDVPHKDTSAKELTAYRVKDDGLTRAWSTRIDDRNAHVWVDPSNTWGTAGRTHFTLNGGKTSTLPPEWKTLDGNALEAWSRSEQTLRVDAQGGVTALQERSDPKTGYPGWAIPGIGVLEAQLAGDTRLYGLMIDPGEPYEALPDKTATPETPESADEQVDPARDF